MQKIKIENGKDIWSWCPNIEEKALDQMRVIAHLPYTEYCALMPDAHFGQNMPIGGVVATNGVIVPDMVGADIGCGMCAIKSDVTIDQLTEDKRLQLFNLLSQAIPVGSTHNTDRVRKQLVNEYEYAYRCLEVQYLNDLQKDVFTKNIEKDFFSQLGTLGGGNHFAECQVDSDGYVWFMIHSGSRNIGKRVGDHFNELATEENKKWFSSCNIIPFLPTDTDAGKDYINWMNFALNFAFLNRSVMMTYVKEVFARVFPDALWITEDVLDVEMLNIHHNFAAIENHHGKNVWVHRKGATKAYSDKYGIIPGNMGGNSFIVKGLGNHKSLMSCSHGAGRTMGRRDFSRQMKDDYGRVEESLKGILHTGFGEFAYGKDKGLKDVSEAPEAYKDIHEVMANQDDLVETVVTLQSSISIKGK